MNSDYQGKRPKQAQDSENITTLALICIIISIVAAAIANYI